MFRRIISTTRPGETSLWHRHSENTLYVCVEHAAAALNRPTDKVWYAGFSSFMMHGHETKLYHQKAALMRICSRPCIGQDQEQAPGQEIVGTSRGFPPCKTLLKAGVGQPFVVLLLLISKQNSPLNIAETRRFCLPYQQCAVRSNQIWHLLYNNSAKGRLFCCYCKHLYSNIMFHARTVQAVGTHSPD